MNRRNTPAKKAILELLQNAGTALSQDKIEAVLKGGMDRVTIYRVLNRFCEDGVTHKIVADDGKSYYALCRGCSNETHNHNHFHFRCVSCGTIECLDEQVSVSLPGGYTLESLGGWAAGRCAQCC